MGQFAVRVTKTNDDTRPDYDNDETTQNSQIKWHFGRKGTTGRCRCCLLMMPPPCRYRIRCSGCLFGSKAGATGQSRLLPYGRDRRFATNRLVTVQSAYPCFLSLCKLPFGAVRAVSLGMVKTFLSHTYLRHRCRPPPLSSLSSMCTVLFVHNQSDKYKHETHRDAHTHDHHQQPREKYLPEQTTIQQ